jgi:MFS family permease
VLGLFAGPLAGKLGTRFGSRVPLVVGMLLAALGIALFAVLHVSPWEISLGMVFIGIGVPFAYAAMAKLIVDAVRPTETGVATGMNTVMRTVGGVIGGQVGAALLTSDTIGRTHVPAESAFVIAFWISAGVALLGALFALRTNERPTRSAFAD